MVKIDGLDYYVGRVEILKDIFFKVKKGQFVGIIGPNGSGKSTLIRNICGLIKPSKGKIFIEKQELCKMKHNDIAKNISVVLQESDAAFDFTVSEVMEMSRYPYKKAFESINSKDEKIILEALDMTEMRAFASRDFLSLSGGEKQRVLISRALAQDTEVLVLDEPTNHLDLGSQLNILDLLKKSNKTIIAALHDLTIASRYCDIIYVIKEGRIISFGKPTEVINIDLVRKLYGIESEVISHRNNLFISFN